MNYTKILTRIVLNTQINTSRNVSFHSIIQWYRGLWTPQENEPPYNHVVQIGDPVLRLKAEIVSDDFIKSNEMKFVIKNMKQIMERYDCVGLSAPQIGLPLRMFAIQFSYDSKNKFTNEIFQAKQMEIVPFTVFINPEVKITNFSKVTFSEACESIRGFSADVPRFLEVECTGINQHGEKITMQAKGWTARIIQHEIDHLNGIVYTDLMDRKSLICTCWEAVNKHEGKINLEFYPK